jgi:hypothetical protein
MTEATGAAAGTTPGGADILGQTPEEKAAALAAAQAAAGAVKPAAVSRDDALAKMAELKANGDWTKKYLAGDPSARKEMADLVKASLATPDESEFVTRMAALQKFGLPSPDTEAGKDLLEVISGKPISIETRRAVEAKRSQLMADKGFVQKYLDGDAEARRVFTTINVLMAAQVERRAS